jgi:mono/diheme cytochrome c family protein
MLSLKMKLTISCTLLVLTLLLGCSHKNEQTKTASGSSDGVSSKDTSKIDSSAVASVHLTYEQRQGKNLYTKFCSVCHGTEGKGDGFNSFNLEPKPRDLSDDHYMSAFTDDRLAQTVREGGRSVNRSSLMPSWGGRLTKGEIIYVVAYVRSLTASNKPTH